MRAPLALAIAAGLMVGPTLAQAAEPPPPPGLALVYSSPCCA